MPRGRVAGVTRSPGCTDLLPTSPPWERYRDIAGTRAPSSGHSLEGSLSTQHSAPAAAPHVCTSRTGPVGTDRRRCSQRALSLFYLQNRLPAAASPYDFAVAPPPSRWCAPTRSLIPDGQTADGTSTHTPSPNFGGFSRCSPGLRKKALSHEGLPRRWLRGPPAPP